jgi:taurine dioxygenase
MGKSKKVLRLRRLTPALGAEAEGPDLAAALSEAQAKALRQALAEHQVLVFREQRLDPAALARLTASLGPVLRVPYIGAMAEQPDVIAVLKEAEERNISVLGGDWHSDFSFLERPPLGSLLHAVEVPPIGGDTLFASQTAAYETLSEGLRALLDGLDAIHSGHVYGTNAPPAQGVSVSRSIPISRNNPDADVERAHPAVRLHPETGRKALFVNPIYTTRFAGWSEAESRPLLEFLYRHATREAFVYRHRWRPGDLLFWDNRSTLHFAVNDYDGHRRLLYRTTIAGEIPRPPARGGPAA